MVKIRLARIGSKKRPFYKIVIADSRCPRNGKFIEKIGFFDSIASKKNKNINLNFERLQYWLQNGALMSNKVKYLVKTFSKKQNT
ncbi:30S ribosomal protein S16 [Buchnera aphidicola (Schlechtendalia chinensis)]|uniref:Small ribosomal subunit protein bS16 n=1 Tax=Buchnera aphidicola subsp. Schlechtendalia chinensis TaxID=118110 RepID=A0A172WDS7_BUCSC|nr:30S ribosomal protein S16 [Buchnera aphidicola]ANF17129.1 30S ribosomal protein S16 [Buchnera aphidicola (Schlechtendalia chinensis)]